MLQSLGVSSAAEALYLILAPLETAAVGQLAELMATDSDEATRALAELQSLGLARPSGADAWQALPLLDAVHALRSQRVCRDRGGDRRRGVDAEPHLWPPRAPSRPTTSPC